MALHSGHVPACPLPISHGLKAKSLSAGTSHLRATGPLTKLVDTTDNIDGKPLADFSFGAGGFSGNQAVFAARFTDGPR
jgi:hypothetical protein